MLIQPRVEPLICTSRNRLYPHVQYVANYPTAICYTSVHKLLYECPVEWIVPLVIICMMYYDDDDDDDYDFQIGAGLYAVGRPVQKRNDEDGQIGTIQSLPLERGALFNRFFGEPAHGPPHVAGGASGPIGGCRDESRTDNQDLDLRHVFDRNNRKTDLI